MTTEATITTDSAPSPAVTRKRERFNATLTRFCEAGKAGRDQSELLPPFPVPAPKCCADPTLRLIEEGYSRCTHLEEQEDGVVVAQTDGWDDYSEEGFFQYVECLSCHARWASPESLDYV